MAKIRTLFVTLLLAFLLCGPAQAGQGAALAVSGVAGALVVSTVVLGVFGAPPHEIWPSSYVRSEWVAYGYDVREERCFVSCFSRPLKPGTPGCRFEPITAHVVGGYNALIGNVTVFERSELMGYCGNSPKLALEAAALGSPIGTHFPIWYLKTDPAQHTFGNANPGFVGASLMSLAFSGLVIAVAAKLWASSPAQQPSGRFLIFTWKL